MYLNYLKNLVGIFMIIAHFGAMLLVLVLGGQHFKFDQCLDVILILAPLFSAFTLAIVSEFIKRRHSTARGRKVNIPFVFVTLFFSIVYAIAVFGLIIAWPAGWIDSIDQLKRGLGACETLIGAALGLVLGILFDVKPLAKDPV